MAVKHKTQNIEICPHVYDEKTGNLRVGYHWIFMADKAIAWEKIRSGIEYKLKPEPAGHMVGKPNLDTKHNQRLVVEYASHMHTPTLEDSLKQFKYDSATGNLKQWGKTFKLVDALEWERQGKPKRSKSSSPKKPIASSNASSPKKPIATKSSPKKPIASSNASSKGQLCVKLVDGRAGEDRIKTLEVGDISIFAIFDGHGAGKTIGKGKNGLGYSETADYLVDNFDQFKSLVKPSFPTTTTVLRIRAEKLFKDLDDKMKALKLQHGATATVCLHNNANGDTFFIHLADSRAIWRDDSGKEGETHDHSPNDPKEKARVEAAGGVVAGGRVWGDFGGLAVSRAFGDFGHKQPMNQASGDWVSAVPEITGDRNKPIKISKKGSYLLLASDGLWTYADNKTVRESIGNCDSVERIVAVQNVPGRDDFSIVLLKK